MQLRVWWNGIWSNTAVLLDLLDQFPVKIDDGINNTEHVCIHVLTKFLTVIISNSVHASKSW